MKIAFVNGPKKDNRLRKNLANFITFIGFVDAFALLVIAIYRPELLWLIDVLYLIGGLTDSIDGPIARKLGIESLVGSLLDRLRDTVLVYPTLAVLIWHHRWNFANLARPAQIFSMVFASMAIGLQILIMFTCGVGIVWYLGGKKIDGKKIDLEPSNWGKKKIFCGFIIVLIWLTSLTVEKYLGFPLIKFSIWLIIFGLARYMTPWSYKSFVDYCTRGRTKEQD